MCKICVREKFSSFMGIAARSKKYRDAKIFFALR